jgi:hypothetical protein
MPTRIRWVAIAAGCVAGVFGIGLTFIFPIFSIPLIVGAITQPRSTRSGRWLMWVGALLLSCFSLYFAWSVMVDDLRNSSRYHDSMILIFLFLAVATVILLSWCDVELVLEAVKLKRIAKTSDQQFSRSAEGLIWLVAFCLSVWVFPQIPLDPLIYRNYFLYGNLVNLAFPILLQLAVITFDAALVIRAVKMRRRLNAKLIMNRGTIWQIAVALVIGGVFIGYWLLIDRPATKTYQAYVALDGTVPSGLDRPLSEGPDAVVLYRTGHHGVICFDEFHSRELHDRLLSRNSQSVTVEYDTFSDFGKVRGYNVGSVDGIRLANGYHVLKPEFAGSAGVAGNSTSTDDCW